MTQRFSLSIGRTPSSALRAVIGAHAKRLRPLRNHSRRDLPRYGVRSIATSHRPSWRNLGSAAEAADLLFAELQAPSDELDGAIRAFLALALVDLGREREAVAVSLVALSKYLPRYNRLLARYANEIAPTPRIGQPAP